MLLNQNSQGFMGDTFILLLYGALILYFIYKIYKRRKAAKNAEGQVYKFKKHTPILITVLSAMLVGFGIFSIINNMVASGVVMIALVLAMTVDQFNPHIFAENGFVENGNWVDWKEVKKWDFDEQSGELVVQYKKGFENKTGYLRLNKDQIEDVQALFRKYKLNK